MPSTQQDLDVLYAPFGFSYFGNSLGNTIKGSSFSDTIYGRDGNDFLYGRNGDDWLIGGEGQDYLDGGAGYDAADYRVNTTDGVINLAAGTVSFAGFNYTETLVNIEEVLSGSGNDWFYGDSGTNEFWGGAGNDHFQPAGGNDFIYGESGTDYAIFTGNFSSYSVTSLDQSSGQVIINGPEGSDVFLGVEYFQFADQTLWWQDLARPPEIVVTGNGFNIVDGDTTPSTADGTDFGTLIYGSAPVAHTFTVSNIGTGTLQIIGVSLPAGLTMLEGLSSTIGAGGSDTFTVQFNTNSVGVWSGVQISITNNDLDESPFNFNVTGTVLLSPSQPPEIAVSGNGSNIIDGDTVPSPFDFTDFGTTAQGGPVVQRTFFVRNNGGSTLTLGSVSLPQGFSLVEGLSSSIPVGNSDTFTVQLNTSSAGTWAGDISFSTNDSDENPFNFRIAGNVTAPVQPDLRAYVGFGSTTIQAGSSAQITYYGVNWGAGSSPASSARIYLSTDANITTADTPLLTVNSPALGAYSANSSNWLDTQSQSLSFAGVNPGTYYVGGIADYTGSIAESDETNNTYNVTQITITAPMQPDLRAYVGFANTMIPAGSSAQITYYGVNWGAGSSPASSARIYLSTDANITTADTPLLTVNSPILGAYSANSSSWLDTQSLSLSFAGVNPGTYYVGGIADYTGSIAESDETNNTYNVTQITVTAPAKPDLRAYVGFANTMIQAGSSAPVDFFDANFGMGTAPTSITGIYLSTDPNITTADTLLMTVNSPALAAYGANGGSWYDHQSLALSFAGVNPGTYYVGGIADYTGSIAESNETNNTNVVTQITVTAPVGGAHTTVLQPGSEGQDLWITNVYSYNDNYGVNNDVLRVGGWGDYYYSLLRFDLASAGLPSHITSATLRLYNNSAQDETPTGMYVDKLNTAWTEAYGWYDLPGANGSAPGLSTNNVGTTTAPPVTGWLDIDVTQLANAWLQNPASNDGILLRPFGNGYSDAQGLSHPNFNEFVSSDAGGAMAQFHPQLVVNWNS